MMNLGHLLCIGNASKSARRGRLKKVYGESTPVKEIEAHKLLLNLSFL